MRNLKGLISVILLFGALISVKASHYAGVEIAYKHISGNDYCVYLFVIRDQSGSNAINNDLCVRSSCFPNEISVAMTPYNDSVYQPGPGGIAPVVDQGACADGTNNNGAIVSYEVRVFEGCVTLPGQCADWTFEYNGYARNPAIDNIQNPGTSSLFGQALLNNQIGPNTSPYFIKPAAKRFCVSQPGSRPFIWSQAAVEPDGDSVYYDFALPREGGTGTGCQNNVSNIPFTAGYSRTQPMTTLSGINIDHKTGTFTFSPSQQETVVLSIIVEEWRFNNTTLLFELVGTAIREMQVSILQNCSNAVDNGPTIATSQSGFSVGTVTMDSLRNFVDGVVNNGFSGINGNGDSLVNVPIIDYNCNDDAIYLKFDRKVQCSSIDPTDFRVIGPDGVSRPVEDVQTNCSAVNVDTDEMFLSLHQSLDINGIYALYIKRGNDGNTLINECGFELVDKFFMLIKVEDCPELSYEITNVTVVDDEKIKVQYDLDPLSYFANTFNRIDVLRANNDQNFQRIGEITNQAQREYTDTQLDKWAVDNQAYQYIFQMVTNSNPRLPTNFVNSILLTATETDGQLDLEWEEYLNDTYGAPAEYEVFVGDSVTNPGQMTWVSLQNTGITRNYTYTIPENVRVWLKVEGYDPSTVNNLRSESNWVEIGSSTPPPPPIVDPVVTYVPNIITPNNDGINDRFYFSLFPQNPDERPYSNVELSIFNRWGKQVFYDDNYMDRNNEIDGWNGTDQNTGATLADGVYFYVAKFSDVSTGKTEERNGSVTLGASL
jgi:gliding motility-associated-like protein